MKTILIQDALGANHFIRQSLITAFQKLTDYKIIFWDDQVRSAFDIFNENSIDIALTSTWQLDRALVKNLLKRLNIKLGLFADMYGPLQEQIDLTKYPVGTITEQQLEMTRAIVENMNVAPLFITQHNESWIEKTHGFYQRDFGLKAISLLTCADVTAYYPTKPNPDLADNFVYCGGYWPFKSKYLKKYVLPLTDPSHKLKGKIFGSGWGVPNAVGRASDDTIRQYYASVDFVPSIYEPHAIEVYSDLPQRCFQVPACGGLQLSQNAVGLDEVFEKNEIKTFEDLDSYLSLVEFYVAKLQKCNEVRINGCKAVFARHTNFHRVHTLFSNLVENTEVLDEIIDRNYLAASKKVEEIYGDN